MSEKPRRARPQPLRTSRLAARSGYSVQQIRDLERVGVIPPAGRGENNYRHFTDEHVVALRAYRALAIAVGPVVARDTMRGARTMPLAEAAARISALHVDLAKQRHDTLAALAGLRAIRAEAGEPFDDTDAMSISELADALGVRPSTLRFWEQEGLIAPERVTSLAVRRYPAAAIREARITAALRAADYRIPAVRETIDAIRRLANLDEPIAALQGRVVAIGQRMIALLNAGTDLARVITTR